MSTINALVEQELQEELEFDTSFKIENIEQLNWTLRKIDAYKKKKAQIAELAGSEIKRIKEWESKEIETVVSKLAYFESLAGDYANRRREEDSEFKKETTPYGKIAFTKQPLEWKYTNEEETIQFLESDESLAGHIVTEKKIANKSKIKTALEVKKSVFVKNGEVVDIGIEMPTGLQGLQYMGLFKTDSDEMEIVDMNTGEVVNDVQYYEIAAVANDKIVPGLTLNVKPDKLTVETPK